MKDIAFKTEPFAPDTLGVSTIEHEISHELGADFTAPAVEDSVYVKAARTPTVVRIKSRVISDTANRMNSREYVASVRRRKVSAIRDMVLKLQGETDRDDFEVCVHPIVVKLRESIEYLLDAAAEGNTREILRQVRDTMMDGGWDSYRSDDFRRRVAEILRNLKDADELTAGDAENSLNQLSESLTVPCLFDVEEDVEEEAEVFG